MNPRISRHPVAVEGVCCTVELVADAAGQLYRAEGCEDPDTNSEACTPLVAPDRSDPLSVIPVRLSEACSDVLENELECAALPTPVAQTPGVLNLPAGCEAALEDAGLTALENLESDIGAIDTPWNATCRRPQADTDFDGIGGVCDKCPLDYDPTNQAYVDDGGRLWPNDGAICNGDFLCVE